jgi:adenosylcobinamide amidohydrolase
MTPLAVPITAALPLVDPLARMLVVRLGGVHDVLSWAIVNGGRRRARAVVWHEVHSAELGPGVDPCALLKERLQEVGLPDAVGLLTARALSTYETVMRSDGDRWVRCVATVGLSNAVSVGDPALPLRVGTINLLCQLSCAVTEEALLEACAIAVEARTAAITDAGLMSALSGRVATGTGTDCVVVAAPASEGAREPYAGKHTKLGALLGRVVRETVHRGAERWIAERL